MKRRILSIVLLGCLLLPLAPAAFAHDLVPRTVVVGDSYAHVYYRDWGRGVPPRWLHTHAPFQQWYHGSRYRYVHDLSWVQLYDLYRVDVRHSRPVRHYHWRGCRHDRHRHYRGRGHH